MDYSQCRLVIRGSVVSDPRYLWPFRLGHHSCRKHMFSTKKSTVEDTGKHSFWAQTRICIPTLLQIKVAAEGAWLLGITSHSSNIIVLFAVARKCQRGKWQYSSFLFIDCQRILLFYWFITIFDCTTTALPRKKKKKSMCSQITTHHSNRTILQVAIHSKSSTDHDTIEKILLLLPLRFAL